MEYVKLFLLIVFFSGWIVLVLYYNLGDLFKKNVIRRKEPNIYLNSPIEWIDGSILEDYYRGPRIIKTLEIKDNGEIIGEIFYKGLFRRRLYKRYLYDGEKKYNYWETIFDKKGNEKEKIRVKEGEEQYREIFQYSNYNASTKKYKNKVQIRYEKGNLVSKNFWDGVDIIKMVSYDKDGEEFDIYNTKEIKEY